MTTRSPRLSNTRLQLSSALPTTVLLTSVSLSSMVLPNQPTQGLRSVHTLQPAKKGDIVWRYRVLGGNTNQDSMWWRRKPFWGKSYVHSCWPSHIGYCLLNPLSANCGAQVSTRLLLSTDYDIVPKVILLQLSPCWEIERFTRSPRECYTTVSLLCFLHRMRWEFVSRELSLQAVLTTNSWHVSLSWVPE